MVASLLTVSVATIFLISCTRATNDLAIRKSEGMLIAPDIFDLAPAVAIALTRVSIHQSDRGLEFTDEGGATAILLPNGELLTVSHIFRVPIGPATESAKNVVFPFVVGSETRFVSVVESNSNKTPNCDWALLSLMPSKNSALSQVLASPLRTKLRFDGSAFIPKGTPLYCIGFPRAPEASRDLPPYGRALVVVQGRAKGDSAPDEEITAISDTELDMRGMSGGPVATYNNLTGEFTIVGIAVRGTYGSRLFGSRFGQPLFLTSRIPPSVMQRLESHDQSQRTPPDMQMTPSQDSN